jgi:hypothetical protein
VPQDVHLHAQFEQALRRFAVDESAKRAVLGDERLRRFAAKVARR